MQGQLIAFEGIDGSGTTTHSRRFVDWLNRGTPNGAVAYLTREPSAGPVGKFLRTVLSGSPALTPRATALLFAADRLDHLAREIDPKRNIGVHVVTDRYVLSSLAYQTEACADEEWVRQINREATLPELTIYLRLDAHIAFARVRERGAALEIYEAEGLQKRIAAQYERLLRLTDPAAGWTPLIDGAIVRTEDFSPRTHASSSNGRPRHTIVVDADAPVEQARNRICDAVRAIGSLPLPS